MTQLTEQENRRYFRQLILPDFGEEAQLKLKNSTVLVSGAGGLGSPASLYLTAAGVGRIIIFDNDKVELSNLNRQIMYLTADQGTGKAVAAGKLLNRLNPDITIDQRSVLIGKDNIESIAEGVDIMVDCLDNLETRMVLNDFSIRNSVPLVHAGIEGWSGQITLLNPPVTPCMACLFGNQEEQSKPAPVIGAVVGVLGTLQGLEVIKYLTGIGNNLENRLLYFEGLNSEFSEVEIGKDEDCNVCL